MMAQVAQQAGRFWDRFAATIPTLLAIGALIWQFASFQATTETRLRAVEDKVVTISAEQAAGRTRGDGRQAQISANTAAIVGVNARITSVEATANRIEDKVDRLLEQRFGSAAPYPTRPFRSQSGQ